MIVQLCYYIYVLSHYVVYKVNKPCYKVFRENVLERNAFIKIELYKMI